VINTWGKAPKPSLKTLVECARPNSTQVHRATLPSLNPACRKAVTPIPRNISSSLTPMNRQPTNSIRVKVGPLSDRLPSLMPATMATIITAGNAQVPSCRRDDNEQVPPDDLIRRPALMVSQQPLSLG
jgi:hypothetical protein